MAYTDYKKLGEKPKFGDKKKSYKKGWKPKEEKFDIEKWIKQHQNIEYPKRSKKNTVGKDRRKR